MEAPSLPPVSAYATRSTLHETREALIRLAKAAEVSERFEDMRVFLRDVVVMGIPLTIEERHMLATAYKNVIGALRAAFRMLVNDNGPAYSESMHQYRMHIATELDSVCNEALFLTKTHLLKTAADPSSQVYYLKQAGDYHRYLAEIPWSQGHPEGAHQCYESAFKIARAHLQPADPVRLGLALNYSVCAFDIFRRQDLATSIARTSFDEVDL